jgi:hypothetical protein
MALHTYNFQALQQAAQHASGVATPATGSSWADVVNDAIQFFSAIRHWAWLDATFSLNFVAAQNYVALASDFGQLKWIQRVGAYKTIRPASWDTIFSYRAGATITLPDTAFVYCIRVQGQASVTAAPIYRIELYPTPAANETGALIGAYRRVLPALSGNTDLPDIPASFHPALKCLVRAFAVSDENEQNGVDWERFNGFWLPKLEELDGTVQQNIGMMQGGVEPVDEYSRLYPSSITF